MDLQGPELNRNQPIVPENEVARGSGLWLLGSRRVVMKAWAQQGNGSSEGAGPGMGPGSPGFWTHLGNLGRSQDWACFRGRRCRPLSGAVGQAGSLLCSLSLGTAPGSPSCSPKGRGRTFDNPVFRLLTGHDKVGLKLELSELGKIENVRFLALLCWGMNYTPVTLLLFLTSFPPSSSFHGPGWASWGPEGLPLRPFPLPVTFLSLLSPIYLATSTHPSDLCPLPLPTQSFVKNCRCCLPRHPKPVSYPSPVII